MPCHSCDDITVKMCEHVGGAPWNSMSYCYQEHCLQMPSFGTKSCGTQNEVSGSVPFCHIRQINDLFRSCKVVNRVYCLHLWTLNDDIMTLHGNAFHIPGTLWGESTGDAINVIFHPNTSNRHSISQPWVQGMGFICEFMVWYTFVSMSCFVPYGILLELTLWPLGVLN